MARRVGDGRREEAEGTVKVLMIDGPMRGQLFEAGDARAVRCLDYGAVSDVMKEDVPVRTYHVHRYVLAGRVLLLGSTELLPSGEVANDVFWDLLASDMAREASPAPIQSAPCRTAEAHP
jgi:hypothetical protein